MKLLDMTIGVDEVGMGALAGPCVAAAVILDDRALDIPIRDSKKMTKNMRSATFDMLTQLFSYGVGIVNNLVIDKVNIKNAALLAMNNAIAQIDTQDHKILIDGKYKPFESDRISTIIKGDNKYLAIAAASIIAKVTRDKIMEGYSIEYPHYGWERNAGYGTKQHLEGIKKYGISKLHRRSFRLE